MNRRRTLRRGDTALGTVVRLRFHKTRNIHRLLAWGVVSAAISASLGCTRVSSESAAGPQEGRETSKGLALLDLDGNRIDPLATDDAEFVVFLFVRSDCPISNRYAPEVTRLHAKFAPQGVRFWLVYCDPNETVAVIRKHLRDFDYPCPALRDTQHQLVTLTQASVTPEAVAFAPGRRIVYRGRIDNRYTDFGKSRAKPTRSDLADALEAMLAGRDVANPVTKAVGCYIADLEST